MIGSDFDRPGLVPRANYNIGIGHTFAFLKKDPVDSLFHVKHFLQGKIGFSRHGGLSL
jgi:hypothetical protein